MNDMSNATFKLITPIVFACHVGVLVCAGVLKRGLAPVYLLNLVLAIGALAYWLPRGTVVFKSPWDAQAVVLMVFEIIIVASSLAAFVGWRIPAAIIWTEFGIHFCLSLFLTVFAWFFKMTRLL